MSQEFQVESASNKSLHFRMLIVSLAALALAAYLSYHHIVVTKNLNTGPSNCSINNLLDCDAVAKSKYSQLFGIPISNFGLGFYLIFSYILFLPARRLSKSFEIDSVIYLFSFLAALVSFCYLMISGFLIGKVCLYCTLLYVCGFLLFVLAIGLAKKSPKLSAKSFVGKLGVGIKHLFSWISGLSTAQLVSDFGALALSALCIFYAPNALSNYLTSPVTKSGETASLETEILEESYRSWKYQKCFEFSYTDSGEIAKRDFAKGSANPKVTVVEFSDMECPHCRRASPVISSIVNEFQDDVRLVFKAYPLDPACNSAIQGSAGHKNACRGARAMRCAGQISDEKFWLVHDSLYQFLEFDSSLIDSSEDLFTDPEERTRYKVCMSESYPVGVEKDIADGQRAKVRSTPSVFVNGCPMEYFEEWLLRYILAKELES